MEKKSKYRLLGVLIVISLVVMALPFFQSEKESSTEIALVKTPPFPDLSTQEHETIEPRSFDDQFAVTQHPSQQPNQSDAISKQTDQVNSTPSTPEANHALQPVTSTVDQASEVIPLTSNELSTATLGNHAKSKKDHSVIQGKKKSDKHVSTKKKTPSINSYSLNMARSLPLENNGLVHFKGAVWVIQLGSFKNKADALRLTNRLRSNGYRAFIQQVSTSFGHSIRVFVGPEYQQDSAFALVEHVANHLHIRGVVVSYKPLTM